ncbi:MAG TPA: sensor histidine kinase [Planctomycetaceae bacterium]|nr:sensor histidine kinase [Planctomycetaceae bacterium]
MTLGVVMIVLVVLLTVGWVLLSVFGALNSSVKAFYWTALTVGAILFVVVLVGTIIYLSLSIKAINLTRRQSNFMDSVSHELKSPIASLKLSLQTLTLRSVSDDERQAFHRLMLEDIERLDELINHLLDAARLERPDAPDRAEWLRSTDVLLRCIQAVRTRYRLSEDRIRLTGPDARIRARQVDLEMIFRNLLDNAVKYGGEEPLVEVRTRWERGTKPRLVVQVADNGKGIPIGQRRRIFRRFERLGVELERTKPGTGLGLYIVGTLVRRLRGSIRVLGRAGEAGTVFEVAIPASPIETSETAEST